MATDRLPEETDVLVVGAGPAGLALAVRLAADGVDALLVDKQAEGANTSRAAVVHARTLEVLRTIGVADTLVGRGVKVDRFTVRDRDRALLTLRFDELPTDFPYTLLVPQNVTEAVLLDRLHEVGGAVRRPLEVTDLQQDGDGVSVRFAGGESVRARYVVGADGMHSVVREKAGIAFTGDTYAESFVLADVRMDWPLGDEEIQLYFSPDGLVVVAPLPGGRHRIVATMEEAPPEPDAADVQALLDARGPKHRRAKVGEVVWSSRFRVHHRLAEHYRSGRLLLAGDAAHVHSPAGGQGMNTGIQDALELGARLAAALHDKGEDGAGDALDGYEAARRPVAEQVVAFTHRMTKMATVGNAPARIGRNAVLRALDWLPPVHRSLAMNLSELATDPERADHGDR